MKARVDLQDGVVTVAAGRAITWLHVPRLRLVLRGRRELDDVIMALMEAREALIEDPAPIGGVA